MKIFSVIFYLLLATANPVIADIPTTPNITLSPYIAKYEATWKAGWFPVTIEAKRELSKLEDGSWQLTFEAYSSIADLHEASKYNIEDNTIRPLTYRYKTSGFLSKKKRGQTFDWDKRQTFIKERDEWANYELTFGTQDNLSYQEQIRLDLIAGKTEFSYQIAYKNRLKEFKFKVANTGKIKTKNGDMNTVEVIQINKKHKESTQIWFAVDYEYLLIKLKNKESNGDSNTIKLKSAQINNQTLLGL
ncbi:DUF3108 domain-containing protein [Oceaniserpentilla sp. 4NH20-0058]|uniref:DUF3108 domain-containing protein n=1 Tax=Oceaniserpentilla sp. 4NH20-0058 TaxID=3127660 RepID=UPI003341E00C